MFLKSIDLFGFKSFATRSHIEFTDGISALVGPNGCGKSNVVDAVKWVLGEQGTKSLRADRMEDVIFNGTDARKPVNVAEVTLTLQNNGVLPLDVPEIAVKRRLFRSGESEYYINNTPVRLKELRELFYDTGIGKSAYSIMEQGRIDQILSTRPEDRRSIFEEAAGITRYKARAKEADRKLERTEENMREVDSILAEVKRSYDTLEKQAEKATQYRELKEKQFEAEVAINLCRHITLQQDEAKLASQVEEMAENRETVKAEIDAINEQLESQVDEVNSREAELVEVQRILYGLEVKRQGRQEQIGLLEERRGEMERQIEAARKEIDATNQRISNTERSRSEQSKRLEDLNDQITHAESTIAAVKTRIQSSRERQQENRRKIGTAEQEIAGHDARILEIQTELRTVTDELVEALDTRLKESGYSAGERSRNEENLLNALEHLRFTLDSRRDRVHDRLRFDVKADDAANQGLVDEAFDELHRAFGELTDSVNAYRQSVPTFLDDFLAPEGIISRKRQLDREVLQLQDANRSLRERIQEWTDENEKLEQTIETERANLQELQLNQVQLQEQVKSHRQTFERLGREADELKSRLKQQEKTVESNTNRYTEIGEQIATANEEIESLKAQETENRTTLRQLEERIAQDNNTLRQEEGRLKEQMKQLAKAQDRLETGQVRLAEKRTEVRSLQETFRERYGRDLLEFGDREIDPSRLADYRREAEGLRTKVKELGSVNLMALEEFQEVKERYDFLSSQLTELRTARDELQKVTDEIHRESEKLFVDTYNRIRQNFHSIFRRLFGGGRAELRLVEPDNVLESGIDILVQPPGKKLESIALLSGGERSMTAVALLFATFMVRPSPFTLLDEIDAALDEHNVGRFVAMLREFAEKSQFVVITHNKKTVVGADTLFGVTMEEGGVSKIVAVRVEEAPTE